GEEGQGRTSAPRAMSLSMGDPVQPLAGVVPAVEQADGPLINVTVVSVKMRSAMALPPASRLAHPCAVRTRRDWIGHGLAGALAVAVAGALLRAPPSRAAEAPPEPPALPAPPPPAATTTDAPPVPPPPPPPRADEKLQREGRSAFTDGYLTLLPGFGAPDGVYDVVFHFH